MLSYIEYWSSHLNIIIVLFILWNCRYFFDFVPYELYVLNLFCALYDSLQHCKEEKYRYETTICLCVFTIGPVIQQIQTIEFIVCVASKICLCRFNISKVLFVVCIVTGPKKWRSKKNTNVGKEEKNETVNLIFNFFISNTTTFAQIVFNNVSHKMEWRSVRFFFWI